MSGFNLSGWALRNRSIVLYLMLLSVLAGVFAFVKLGRNEDPAFTIRTMVVAAGWPGATLDETVKQVTERIERQLQEVPGLDDAAQLHPAGRRHDLRQPQGQRDRSRRARGLAAGAQRRQRHLAHPAARRGRAVLQRPLRRRVRDHLRVHRRRLHATRAARPCRAGPLRAAQRARRIEDRDHRRAGRGDLRRVLDAAAGEPRASTARRCWPHCSTQNDVDPPASSRPATNGSRCA